MTSKALNILSKDEDGFFLIVEGGQIDWAGHSNIHCNLVKLPKIRWNVQTVYEWAKESWRHACDCDRRPRNLGSPGFNITNELPKPQKRSGEAFYFDRDYT